jgi:hypothetical protein
MHASGGDGQHGAVREMDASSEEGREERQKDGGGEVMSERPSSVSFRRHTPLTHYPPLSLAPTRKKENEKK